MPREAEVVLSEARSPNEEEKSPEPPFLVRSETTNASDLQRAAVKLVLEASRPDVDEANTDDKKEESVPGGVAASVFDVCGSQKFSSAKRRRGRVTTQVLEDRSTRSGSQVGAFRISGIASRAAGVEGDGSSDSNTESQITVSTGEGMSMDFPVDSAGGGEFSSDFTRSRPAPPQELSLAADLGEGMSDALRSSTAGMAADGGSPNVCMPSTDVRASLVEDADDSDVERAIREEIIRDAVVADVVEEDKGFLCGGPCRRGGVCVAAVLGFAVIAVLTIGLSLFFKNTSRQNSGSGGSLVSNSPSATPTMTPALPTLETVMGNGYVRCGVYEGALGFALTNQRTGSLEGFSADLCRGIAALVLGDPNSVEFVEAPSRNRFELLKARNIDVLSETVARTMERDVLEPTTGDGFSFSTPFFYSGLAFGGAPEFVDCAEKKNPFYGNCRNLRICVGSGTTHEYELLQTFPGPSVLSLGTPLEMIDAFKRGQCNVVAEQVVMLSLLALQVSDDGDSDDQFELGNEIFTHDSLCLVTIDHDAEWAALVDLMVNILITAEAEGITQATAETWMVQQRESGILNGALILQVFDVISGVGNLGELHERHLSAVVPRTNINLVNTDTSSPNSTGLLFPHPYGDFTVKGAEPTTGRMASVLGVGFVRCAIVDATSGSTQSLRAFHEGFCRALSVALFRQDNPVLVLVSDEASGYEALFEDTVDVVIGVSMTLESLGKAAYTSSTPTFYDHSGGATALVTSSSDQEWSDFINWIVISLIYAESRNITESKVTDMPVVSLWGEELKQTFLDCVAGVGTYADIFNRTLSSEKRTGRNGLNDWNSPLHFPVPLQ